MYRRFLQYGPSSTEIRFRFGLPRHRRYIDIGKLSPRSLVKDTEQQWTTLAYHPFPSPFPDKNRLAELLFLFAADRVINISESIRSIVWRYRIDVTRIHFADNRPENQWETKL